MAQQSKPKDMVTMDVPRVVRDLLNDYKTALQRELGRRATQSEILSALLMGTPLWQANAMLDAYRPRIDPGSGTAER